MRLIALITTVIFLSSCSWIPWRNSNTGNCLDDGTCDEGNPLRQAVIEGTWYCYGKSKDEPWDCGVNPDESKIVAIGDAPGPQRDRGSSIEAEDSTERAEISFAEETISTSPSDSIEETVVEQPMAEQATEIAMAESTLDDAPEASFDEIIEESTTSATEAAEAFDTEISEPAVIEVATEDVTEETFAQPRAVEAERLAESAQLEAEAPSDNESMSISPPDSTIEASHQRVLSEPDDAYAVQLIALQSLEEAESFANGYELSDPIFVQIESQGSDWYVVILDILPDKIRADRVALDWEQEHNPLSRPWVRPLGPLKRATTTL